MTIISLVTVQPKPDAAPEDVQKMLGKAADLARKAGAENVTAVTTVIGGSVTGTTGLMSTTPDWTRYGQVLDVLMADPELQAILADRNSPIASREAYVMQTIDI
jgi:CubicO group peptidase (beta-lactamase class C family)